MRKIRFTCRGCGRCCEDTFVPVTDADVKRLARASRLPPERIVRLFHAGEVDYDRDRDGWIRLSYGMRVMGLRKRNGRCLFLDEEKRCRVYGARAMTCRTFPFDLEIDSASRLRGYGYIKGVDCRRGRSGVVDIRLLKENARRETAEDERYFRKVAAWNRAVEAGRFGSRAGKKDFMRHLFRI